ncbi:DUF4169 family protein [Nitratireductor sp. XY-223]|uniref:DUF4169 family protein n=1 Tax=Nitratireductor sp. XY-223 TaxID=2561926 RepID=UPI0010A9FDC8|nr:DUF4169 family protein [Nitratireductor sp. XY-223]
MSAEVVNLRRHRKRKARQEREKTAEQNRISFGRTKAEKTETDRINRRERAQHDQKRLEQPAPSTRPKK